MFRYISHGILEFKNLTKSNCIIFNGEFVLATATILKDYLFKNDSVLENVLKTDFRVFDEAPFSINVTFKNDKSEEFRSEAADSVYTFHSSKLYSELNKIFGAYVNNVELFLKSTFLIFKIKGIETKLDSFLLNLYSNFNSQRIKILDNIVTTSTPFNNEVFYKSIHIGKIANIEKQILFVLSFQLPENCEGCPVFNEHLKCIGLILFTTLKINNENVNITCGVSMSEIVKSFFKGQSDLIKRNIAKNVRHLDEQYLIRIIGDNIEGSGVLIKIKQKRFILSCAHVLKDITTKFIKCEGVMGIFDCNLIWKNKSLPTGLDLAILEAPKSIDDRYFTTISPSCNVGQSVIACGFPFFSSTDKFTPFMYEGRIVKYSMGLIIHDATVQYRQSGGPLLDTQGKLVGICVSNIKAEDRVYPNMCFAIPMQYIEPIINECIGNNDITILNKLIEVPENMQYLWDLRPRSKL